MLNWLVSVAVDAGLTVRQEANWQTRGKDSMNPQALVIHHTGTSPNGRIYPTRRILRDGRSDLPGPLCHYGLARDGEVWVVAAGRANHAGRRPKRRGGRLHAGAPFPHLKYNSQVIGIEAEGDGKHWPPVMLDAWYTLCAAICLKMNWPASHVISHQEWTARKWDPGNINMDQFRTQVAAKMDALRSGTVATPAPAAAPAAKPAPAVKAKALKTTHTAPDRLSLITDAQLRMEALYRVARGYTAAPDQAGYVYWTGIIELAVDKDIAQGKTDSLPNTRVALTALIEGLGLVGKAAA